MKGYVMTKTLKLLIGTYVVGGFLLPMLNLNQLMPFQFLIAGLLMGYVSRVAKKVLPILIIGFIIHFAIYMGYITIPQISLPW